MKLVLLLFPLLWLGLVASAAPAQTPPTLSIADASIVEGNSRFRELLFPVTLSKSQSFDVSASFKTRDISAVANSDYTPQSAGQIVIKAGQTRANILIRVVGDTTEERDESFLVQLGQPKRCGIADSDGIGFVKDDDYAGRIFPFYASGFFSEGNSGQKVVKTGVYLSQACLHPLAIRFETKDESAKASQGDYISTSGTLLFKPGRTVLSVEVPVVGDLSVEKDEKFFIRLSAPGLALSSGLAPVTILDDDAPPPTLNGKIAFVSSRDGNQEIYVMNADGSHQTRLTNNRSRDINPSFSADGSKIVFVSDRDSSEASSGEIYVMDADGSNPTRLTETSAHENNPSFSPDGLQIVYDSTPASDDWRDKADVWVMNADGSRPIRLTTSPQEDYDPSFSPDGSQIVFSCERPSTFPRGGYEISVINSDGSGQIFLTQTETLTYTGSESGDFAPAFSPDGSRIVFWSNRIRGSILLTLNPDGSGQTLLPPKDFYQFDPCFSPDGGALAFASSPDLFNGPLEIFAMNADGTGQIRLTNIGFNTTPSWAPGSVAIPSASPNAPPAPSAGNS